MKFAVLVTISLFLAACQSPTKKAMDSWIGHHESELISKWGAPNMSHNLADGSRVYTWVKVWYKQGWAQQGRQTFTVDKSGNVVSFAFENMP